MEIGNFSKFNLKDFAIKFFVFIFPLSLVSGPLIPDLIISISSIFFLIFFYNEILYFIKNNYFIKFFFYFFYIY